MVLTYYQIAFYIAFVGYKGNLLHNHYSSCVLALRIVYHEQQGLDYFVFKIHS